MKKSTLYRKKNGILYFSTSVKIVYAYSFKRDCFLSAEIKNKIHVKALGNKKTNGFFFLWGGQIPLLHGRATALETVR